MTESGQKSACGRRQFYPVEADTCVLECDTGIYNERYIFGLCSLSSTGLLRPSEFPNDFTKVLLC